MSYTQKPEDFGNSRKCNKCSHDLARLLSRKLTNNTKETNKQATCEDNSNSNYLNCVDGRNILNTSFFQCAACNMATYCSREHQIADLEAHKEFCDIMVVVKKKYHVDHPLLMLGPLNANKIRLCSAKLKTIICASLSRPATKLETELITFPAYCAVCYELYKLTPCPCCFGVAYCSGAHLTLDRQKHQAECNKLRIYYCIYQAMPLQHNPYDDLNLRMANLQNGDLIKAVERATAVALPKNPTTSCGDYATFALASSFSHISTICLGMSYVELNYTKGSTYTIFVLGVTDEVKLCFQNMHLKFFFLQYDKITRVELHFIGPQTSKSNESLQKYVFKNKLRTVTYKNFLGSFDQYIKKKELQQPSLIIAFNPNFDGLVEGQKISSSADLQAIIRTHHVPIFITSPTKLYAKLDYASLLTAAHDFAFPIRCLCILELSRNPYADMRPFRNHRLNESETIWYKNNYIQGVMTML